MRGKEVQGERSRAPGEEFGGSDANEEEGLGGKKKKVLKRGGF